MSRWPLILAFGACVLHLTVLGLHVERTYRTHTARRTPAPEVVTAGAPVPGPLRAQRCEFYLRAGDASTQL